MFTLIYILYLINHKLQKQKSVLKRERIFVWLPLLDLRGGLRINSPSYCCGTLRKLRLWKQPRFPQTAATRSGRSSRPRRRSHRSLPPSPRSVGIATERQSETIDTTHQRKPKRTGRKPDFLFVLTFQIYQTYNKEVLSNYQCFLHQFRPHRTYYDN